LSIIGTERQESRRVDRQLRGRAGRQGDPGSSLFFVCLEDDLMRLFGSDRIAKMMDRLGLKEGEVIQHSMITKSIERAQRKVEENNFGIRKRLLEYDDVMNSQREVIYKKRRHALFGERIQVDVSNMMNSLCQDFVDQYHGEIDFETFRLELLRTLAIEITFDESFYLKKSSEEIQDQLYDSIVSKYQRKQDHIASQVLPVITDVYQRHKEQYKNIVIPISDGFRVYQVVVNLEKAYKSKGIEVMRSVEKFITLLLIDESWKEHLREMDDLKTSVQNASYEQKDPLLIYKFESFELFKKLLDKINREVVSVLLKAYIPNQGGQNVREAEERKTDHSKLQTGRSDLAEKKPQGPVKVDPRVGRNDPCPCGSGKKFKQCHGKNA
jgi:preprotein translocase subunit SecA